MGFIDKAKKLAEQAQEKLDEVQENFNQGQSGQAQQGGGVRYDEHGRPIGGPPAGEAPPPSAEPGETAGPAQPAETAEADEQQPPEPAPKPAPEGGADANPDPFKPIQ